MQTYFKELGIHERILYNVLKRYEKRGTPERPKVSGRHNEKSKKQKSKKTSSKSSYSQRQFNISHQYIQIILSSAGYHT